jgi:capsular exopolysaccharide synthesis family protein
MTTENPGYPKPASMMSADSQGTVQLWDYLIILRKRWLLILFSTILFTVGGVFHSANQPFIYRASAAVAVLPPQTRTIGNIRVQQEEPNYVANYYYLNTQQEVIRSSIIAKKVLAKLPEEACLAFFGAGREKLSEGAIMMCISVSQQKDSNILRISCEGKVAEHCATIANLVVDTFIDEYNQQMGSSQGVLLNWLKAEIPRVEQSLLKNREMVFQFEESNPELLFVSTSDTTTGFGVNIMDILKRELQEVKIQLLGLGIQYEKCKEARRLNQVDAMFTLDLFENSWVDKLRQQRYELTNQLDEIKLRYTANHPKYVALTQSLQKLDGKILEDARLVIQRHEMRYNDLKEKEAQLEKMLQEQQTKTLGAKKKYLEYDRYRREYESLQKVYATFVDKMKELDTVSNYRFENIRRVDVARPPSIPYKPNKRQNYIFSFILGLLAGVGLSFMLEMMSERVKTSAELQEMFNAPVHGFVPFMSPKQFSGKFSHAVMEQDQSSLAEAFRAISTALFLAEKQAQQRSFVLSSPLASDGKSTTVCNLAFTIAKAGYKVLLVDGDLRKPRLHDIFELENSIGFAQILRHEAEISQAAREISNGLYCLPSGKTPKDPYGCIYNSDLSNIVEQMKQQYQYVLIDSPPLTVTSDAFLYSKAAQSLLLLVNLQSAHKNMLRNLCQRLQSLQVPLHGIIINDRQGILSANYGYYYGHYKYYKSYYHGKEKQ